jgi:hypothetical protein
MTVPIAGDCEALRPSSILPMTPANHGVVAV